MPDAALVITDMSLSRSLGAWVDARARRGKDYQDSLRKVMKAWVFAAYEMVPKGDRAKIRTYLLQQTRAYAARKSARFVRRRSKAKEAMQGTIAAALAWKLDWKGAKGLRNTQFYALAAKFLRAREFSANIHRAGFFAAFDLVHGRPPGSSGPRYKKSPVGSATENILNDAAEIIAENYASSHGGQGIAGLAGSAFEATLPGVIAKFREYAKEEELKQAQKHGAPLVFE